MFNQFITVGDKSYEVLREIPIYWVKKINEEKMREQVYTLITPRGANFSYICTTIEELTPEEIVPVAELE